MVIKERRRASFTLGYTGRKRAIIGICALLGIAVFGWVTGPYAYPAALELFVQVHKQSYSNDVGNTFGVFRKAFLGSARHYLDGLFHGEDVPRLRLDVKFKHWQKILAEREKALERGYLIGADDSAVPATISLGDQAGRGKIRLKGDLTDHLVGNKSWSLRVESDVHFFGMRRFSLHRPGVREYAAGPLFLEYLRRQGVLAPRYALVNLTVNGSDWGMMELEEHVGTELLESQDKKDGVIGRFDDGAAWRHAATHYPIGSRFDFDTRSFGPYDNYWTAEFEAYRTKKLQKDARTASNLALAKALLAGYQDGTLRPADVFELNAWARYLVATAIWGDVNTHKWGNVRLYLNPFTLKLEPVAGDIESPPRPVDSIEILPRMVVAGFMRDPAFRDALARAVPEVTGRVLEGGLLGELEREVRRIEATMHRGFPLLAELDLSVLRDNAELIARYGVKFFPENEGYHVERPGFDDAYADHVLVRLYDRPERQVAIYNRLHQPVTVERVEAFCAEPPPAPAIAAASGLVPAVFLQAEPAAPPGPDSEPRTTRIELPSDVVIDATPLGRRATRTELSLPPDIDPAGCRIEVTTRRPGSEELRVAEATAPIDTLEHHPLDVADRPEASAAARSWLSWNAAERRFESVAGVWPVDTPLILPEGAGLRLTGGTTLAFAPGAYLVVRGPFDIAGSPGRPVVLKAQDKARPWKGIYVMEAGRASRWQHAEIQDTAALEDGYLILTGAVNFYRSDVTMTDVAFAGTEAEDALNITESQIAIERAVVRDTRSDAFDCDFCEGTVANSVFSNIGGDAIDFSGSRTTLAGLEIAGVRDKAVSVGEASEITVRDLSAMDVGTGVASKDRSRAIVEGARIEDAHVAALMSYVKKPQYGPAYLEANGVTFRNVAREVVVQTGSDVRVDGRAFEGTDVDIEKMYTEGPMKK